MESLRAKRKPLRSAFTRTCNELSRELGTDTSDFSVVQPLLEQLEDKSNRLQLIDAEILNIMIESGASEKDYETEFLTCESYTEKLIHLRTKVCAISKAALAVLPNAPVVVASQQGEGLRSQIRLPKIKLPEFTGDPHAWLHFWNSFRKIHEDVSIDDHSKFVYLIQATAPNSKAREVVESFPTSAENYPKVIAHLKERFGRDDILIQLYVRDLLQIVLCNSGNSKRDFSISSLYDSLETKLRALESLDVTQDKFASILYPLVESCLPQDILRVWEREREKKTATGKSELDLILEFLRNEVVSEERVMLARSSFNFEKNKKRPAVSNFSDQYQTATANDLIVGDKISKSREKGSVKQNIEMCVFCNDKFHSSDKCFKARSLSYETKRELVLKKGACFICLRRNHFSRNCRVNVSCSKCGKRHSTIICPNASPKSADAAESRNSSAEGCGGGAEPMSASHAEHILTSQRLNNGLDSDTLLQTLVVRVSNGSKEKLIRCIIDTGSETSYLTDDVASCLNYESCGEVKLIHKLFGGVETKEKLHRKYKVHVSSLDRKYRCVFYCLDQKVICSDVRKIPEGPWMPELESLGIEVTDSAYSKLKIDSEIKLLIGSDVAGKLLTGRVEPLKSGPVAIQTHLGWSLVGRIPRSANGTPTSSHSVISLLLNDSCVSNLWKLEVIGISDPAESKTKAELREEVLTYFEETVTKDSDGRYEVALPWIMENSCLPSNRELAEKRLLTTERKLLEQGKTQAYQDVFDTWERDNIIERVIDEKESQVHYLPHRPVFKESSETTKVRPVFDASARTKGYPSLNDCLDKGPNLIEIIPSLLNRFRKYPNAVVSDIEKAYLQISVREKDRDYLRFFWRDKDGEVITYRHDRVVFGVSCSSFLLAACLNHHLDRAPNPLVPTADILKESLYVDNCVSSFESEVDMKKFIVESTALLALAKFNLRDWHFNGAVDSIPEALSRDVVPVLGLNWDLADDSLKCKVEFPEKESVITKRVLLSSAHKLFDPIGFTTPVTLIPKLILQECWKHKLTWDEMLPEDLAQRFSKWIEGIYLIDSVKIARWLNLGSECEESSLHIFCDSSKLAYATCMFLRVKMNGKILVSFVSARARVAPLKDVTIPRLELLACLIGARLGKTVISDLRIPNLRVFFWTDSMTALCWIRRDVRWGTFVWNRAHEIRTLTDVKQWRHIPGKMNPADLPSRGCTASQFVQLKWWEGPVWLSEPECSWPQNDEPPDENLINSEMRKSVISAHNKETKMDDWYYKRISKYTKIVRCMAWVLRFVNNVLSKDRKLTPDLEFSEVQQAEKKIVLLIQREAFGEDKEEQIRSLRPVVDDDGIIRVKSQVAYRHDTTNFRYPILLPSNHPVVHRLIEWKHKELMHAGVSLLMSDLRETYWIIRARKTIRAVIQRCVRCQRFSAQSFESVPIPLPTDRVDDTEVFSIVGIDLAGPLYMKDRQKGWVVLYTCAVYRAVHLELVTSISTDAFFQSFRRFIARRGRPSVVYSDNGTNFVGANSAFSTVDWEKISAAAALQRIQWRFNPPTAAWWGGWWERLIQLVKRILRKVLGKASLSYEELITVLCDCEQVVNSRPLTYVTENVSDLPPIRPSMFLHEIPSADVRDLDDIDTQSLNKRLKYLKKVRDDLRRRFRLEYLGQLRQQTLRRNRTKPVSVDDVVLVESDKKRAFWSLARVIALIKGKDGKCRVARLKTESGELLRPIQKLYQLEVRTDSPADSSDRVLRSKTLRKVTVPERLIFN